MHTTKQALIGVAFGVLIASPAALADDDKLRLAGAWKLVSFFTEDVETKTQNHIYGAQPQGYIAITPNGRFFAFATADWSKFATPAVAQIEFRSIFYSGKYRLEGNKFVSHTDVVSIEGWEGSDPFDITWNEGWVGTDVVRLYRLENDTSNKERLTMETAEMQNPNGFGNKIIGKLIWERE